MALPTHTAICLGKELIARDVYSLRFTKPSGFTFAPGQFILFDVPLIENPADVQTRAFSLASLPSEKDLLFIAKLVKGGRASRWIVEALEPGTAITFKGPFGNFTLDPGTEKDVLFIATGTGLAPFRPMILSLLEKKSTQRMDVVFGVTSETDLFWQEEMQEWTSRGNIFTHVTLSEPSALWKGHKGWVQAIAPGVVGGDFRNRSLYICGSPHMTKDVKRLALEEWSVDKKDLHVEGYI